MTLDKYTNLKKIVCAVFDKKKKKTKKKRTHKKSHFSRETKTS